MLPSLLYRNLGIPPLLRNLVLPHPSLPATSAVRIRFPLSGALRASYSTTTGLAATSDDVSSPSNARAEEPRLQITFTCTADNCNRTRSTHQFTKRAYTTGVVLIQCPGCKNRHLIADNLGWFKDSTEGGTLRTIEEILNSKGESVKRGILPSLLEPNKVVEYAPED